MARKRTPSQPAWTPNQIVAHNLAKARLFRGWTQDRAAGACAPYLGARLSPASWSALERSVDGGRIREITADELVAFARAFDLPIGFFLTPPSVWDNHVVATPDAGPGGLEPIELFDVVIGTEENLAAWEQYLLSWPSPQHRVALHEDGTMEHLGRVQEDVHLRLAGPAALRAKLLLRDQFGDLDAARDASSGSRRHSMTSASPSRYRPTSRPRTRQHSRTPKVRQQAVDRAPTCPASVRATGSASSAARRSPCHVAADVTWAG